MDSDNKFQRGVNLDSSLSETIDKNINTEEYKNRIISLLEPILEDVFFNDKAKQQIKVHRDRINFSCPICGDSMQSSYKKRGNIILQGKHRNFFKCFNCGEFKRVDYFFKDFKINLQLDIVNYISDNLGNFNTFSSSKYDISLLLDVDNIERYAIDRKDIKNNFGLIEAKESPIWSWLLKRLQYVPDRFLYHPNKKYILILNLTPSGKIIGVQKRLFKGYPKYITFSASKLYELLGMGEIPDEIDIISQLFGILQIDFNKPITLFEGSMDSFLFRNSIANSGLQKKFPLDIPIRYWFDDDKPGKNKSIELIEKGESVFLWDKLKKDMELPYRKKWDLNDVLIYFKEHNIKPPFFDNYFSNDPLDIIDL